MENQQEKVNFSCLFKFFFKSVLKININIVNSLQLGCMSVFVLAANPLLTLYVNPDNVSPDKPYSDEFPEEKLLFFYENILFHTKSI